MNEACARIEKWLTGGGSTWQHVQFYKDYQVFWWLIRASEGPKVRPKGFAGCDGFEKGVTGIIYEPRKAT